MHIAIAGNIGSGKTTLTSLLADRYGWEAHYEDVDDNPYLNDFYDDMKRWSFNLQIYFLKSRLTQVLEIKKSGKIVIQDRTIYEDAHIFAPNLRSMNLLSKRDFDTYFKVFQLMSSLIEPPDLLIYLRASVDTLVYQIKKRGRSYESNISDAYLTQLNDRYEAWINSYTDGKLLVIDIDNVNYTNGGEQFNDICKQVEKCISDLRAVQM